LDATTIRPEPDKNFCLDYTESSLIFPHYLADGFQFIRVVAWRPNTQQKEESLYDDEKIAMAKDRAAGGRHLDEYGFDGLGPEPLSDTFRRIDLGVHGETLQRGFLSGMDRTRQQP
jgi:hypothetical protein